jgi:hypothetical protein
VYAIRHNAPSGMDMSLNVRLDLSTLVIYDLLTPPRREHYVT